MMSDSKLILAKSILVSIDDAQIGMIESMSIDSHISYRHISSAFEAYDKLCPETEEHNITLSRLKLDNDASDFFNSYKDTTFTLKVALPDYNIVFSNCRLLNAKETCSINSRLIENIQILSYERKIVQQTA